MHFCRPVPILVWLGNHVRNTRTAYTPTYLGPSPTPPIYSTRYAYGTAYGVR